MRRLSAPSWQDEHHYQLLDAVMPHSQDPLRELLNCSWLGILR